MNKYKVVLFLTLIVLGMITITSYVQMKERKPIKVGVEKAVIECFSKEEQTDVRVTSFTFHDENSQFGSDMVSVSGYVKNSLNKKIWARVHKDDFKVWEWGFGE